MKKKILITVPTLKAGGMERAAVNFANSFYDKGFEVYIYTISSDKVFYEINPKIKLIFGKTENQSRLKTIISLFKLRKISKDIKPNIVFSLSGKMSVYVIISLLFTKIEVIPFHRGSPYKIYGYINNLLNNLFFPFVKRFAVQTEEAGNYFKNKYRLKDILLIPNPIRDIDVSVNYNNKKIVTVSRLVNGKGIFDIVDAFNEINDQSWQLFFVGDGELRNELELYIKNSNLSENVFVEGFQKDVDKYLATASIFVFASESEGFPNSLLEAMCSGLACISYDCPTGPSEMIKDGFNGYLVSLKNKNEYIQKLRKLMSDPSLRESFGREARKLNIRHNPNLIIQNLVDNLNL